MAYIDIKRTIWERFDIPDDVIVPEFSNNNEVDEFISDYNLYGDFLLETTADMHVEDNGGCSTIEVYDDFGELIYNN